MADNKTPVVQGDTDISGKKNRKAKAAIHWLKLGKDKDPEFNKPCFLFKEGEHGEHYTTGYLRRKAEEAEKMEYYFHDEKTGEPDNEFTHFAIINKPTN